MLARHPGLVVAPESRLVPLLYHWSRRGDRCVETEQEAREVVELLFAEPKFAVWGLDAEALTETLTAMLPMSVAEVVELVIQEYASSVGRADAVLGIKKGGWYTANIDVLHALFPGARFIYLIRDGRAVFASSRRARLTQTGQPFEDDAALSAATWREGVETLDRLRERVPGLAEAILEVSYEQLVTSTSSVLGRVFQFLGVEAGADQIERAISDGESSFGVFDPAEILHLNVTSPPLPDRIAAWRRDLSAAEIETYERVAGGVLAERGYDVSAQSLWYSGLLYRVLLGRRFLSRRLAGLRRRFS